MTENYMTTIYNVTIKLTQLQQDIGPIEIETKQESPGMFVADAPLNLPGIWSIQIEGQTSEPGAPNIIAIFEGVFCKTRVIKYNILCYRI